MKFFSNEALATYKRMSLFCNLCYDIRRVTRDSRVSNKIYWTQKFTGPHVVTKTLIFMLEPAHISNALWWRQVITINSIEKCSIFALDYKISYTTVFQGEKILKRLYWQQSGIKITEWKVRTKVLGILCKILQPMHLFRIPPPLHCPPFNSSH